MQWGSIKGYYVKLGGIPKGAIIGEYHGEVFKSKSKREDLDYCAQLDDESLVVDAMKRGNNLMFINHLCKPDCKCVQKKIVSDKRVLPTLWVRALNHNKMGEYLSISYREDTKISLTTKHASVDLMVASDVKKGQYGSKGFMHLSVV